MTRYNPVMTYVPRLLLLFSLALLPVVAADNTAVAVAGFDELVRQDYAALSRRFSPQMAAALPAEKLSSAVGPALQSLGALRGARPQPQMAPGQGLQVFTFPAVFEKGKIQVVIAVNAEGQIAGLRLLPAPPDEAKPGELTVNTGDLRLPATLTVPAGDGPFPAVVLVHGSGPHDRDETIAANAPFRDLAEGLAARGIATLRYVKRTKQYPQRPVATVKEEVIDDAVNALALARTQTRIDPNRVFLLGHSPGGYLAPRIAAQDGRVAGIILLAANARPILEAAKEQIEYIGARPETLDLVKSAAPDSYWRDLDLYDPVASARNVRAPILALQGERDYQVTFKDFEMWRQGLKSRTDVVFKTYPKLNHLFLEGEGKPMPAEYSVPGHIPAYVMDDIAAFIRNPAGK